MVGLHAAACVLAETGSNYGVTETRELLLRWHAGDQEAMVTLVQMEAKFVTAQVRRRLGPLLRRHHDTQDITQAMLLQALRTAPRFLVSDRSALRGLLVRMVENIVRGEAVHEQRHKRDIRRELPLLATGDAVLDLDPVSPSTDPGVAATRQESHDWVQLAIELLDHDDRDVILLRDYQELSYGEIGTRLGATEDAVRMRHRRALPKLASMLVRLRRGELRRLI